MSSDDIARAIQRLREQAGLTQEALAEKIGVSQQSVAKWEANKTIPRARVMWALEKTFGVPENALFGLRGPGRINAPPFDELDDVTIEPEKVTATLSTDLTSKERLASHRSFPLHSSRVRPAEYAQQIRALIAPLLQVPETCWDRVVRGNTISWTVDYMDGFNAAQFVCVGSSAYFADAYSRKIPARLWQIATLRAHLKGGLNYMLIITVPIDTPWSHDVFEQYRRIAAEAALLEIYVFVVNTPEQAAAILSRKPGADVDAND